MTRINWSQFKQFKQDRPNPGGLDNFQLLLEFIRSIDNFLGPDEMYAILAEDDLSRQMMEKRGIGDAAGVEEHLYRLMRR